MKSKKNPHHVQFAYDISVESKARFEKIHSALNFKTKSQTLEAIIFQASTKDVVSPDVILRMEAQLDHLVELFEGNR